MYVYNEWNPGEEKEFDVRCTCKTACEAVASWALCAFPVKWSQRPEPFEMGTHVTVMKRFEKRQGVCMG